MKTTSSRLAGRGWQITLSTLALAAAATLAQTALAMPGDGMRGTGMQGMGMHGMGMQGGPGMHGGGRGMERMLDSVGASAEQKAQLRQIMQAARDEMKGVRENNRKLHEQMRALLAQPTVDARAVEALRQQLMAGHEQASKRMSLAMIEASRVLTPEQRKQLDERMQQRRAMMQRHRAERESLEGGAHRH